MKRRAPFRGASQAILSLSMVVIMVLFLHALLVSPAKAGVVADGTFGPQGGIAGPNYAITGNLGKQVGSNLFHSFSEFNIDKGQSATFSGPGSVHNVVGRVTGGGCSTIDGGINCSIQGANLYLVNPGGMVFGPNASLNVSGSFHASTADYLVLSDGGRFDAAHPENSLLTTAPPSAFGFLNEKPPADITIQGSFLTVPDGQTLSFIGGNLKITDGAILCTPGGQINLATAASAGEFGLTGSGITTDSFSRLGDLEIINSSSTVSSLYYQPLNGIDGGSIYIRSGNFVMDNSSLMAESLGGRNGGSIDIRVIDKMSVQNGSRISTDFSSQTGGNMLLDIGSLYLGDGSRISNDNYGSGTGGQLKITAGDEIAISGVARNSQGGVFSSGLSSNSYDSGSAGSISLSTDSLSLTSGGQINTNTFGTGSGGEINIVAKENVSLSGFAENMDHSFTSSGIYSRTYGSGNAGNILMDVGSLAIKGGGRIDSSTRKGSTGNGGQVNISAGNAISISGFARNSNGKVLSSGLSSNSWGSGNAGNISLSTGSLSLTSGGWISADTHGSGAGGEVSITAKGNVLCSGFVENTDGTFTASGILSRTYGSGNAGNILMNVGSLTIEGGAKIDSSTQEGSTGNGGNVNISAGDYISISGFGTSSIYGVYSSRLSTNSYGSGNAGNISLSTGSLTLTGGGQINADTHGSGTGGDIDIVAKGNVSLSGFAENTDHSFISSGIYSRTYGGGNAGNILMDVGSLTIEGGGRIDSSTRKGSTGNGGQVNISAGNAISISGFARNSNGKVLSSGLSSNSWGSGNAGNIYLSTGSLSLTNGGWISADTHGSGTGGEVSITAKGNVLLSGFVENKDGTFTASGILSRTYGSGNAGNISMDVGSLAIEGGARIDSSTQEGSTGDGGNVNISAGDYISISGFGTSSKYGVYSSTLSTNSYGSGNAGNISLSTGSLTLTGGGQIGANTFGTGTGGEVSITASGNVSLSGFVENIDGSPISSGIYSRTYSSGNAGSISMNVGSLTLEGGARIDSSTVTGSTGNGGEISISARDSLNILGYGQNSRGWSYGSGIYATSEGEGNAGDIICSVGSLTARDGGIISASTSGSGRGGSLIITARDFVSLSGALPGIPSQEAFSGLYSKTFASGEAGGIHVTTGSLYLTEGGQISTSSLGSGNAGELVVAASDAIFISGSGASGSGQVQSSGIFSEAFSSGAGGSIWIDPRIMTLKNGGRISTSSYGSGAGGNIQISADRLELSDEASIRAESTGEGNAGNISLDLSNSLWMKNASITTSAAMADGGNIAIKASNMIDLTDSRISATVGGGMGSGGNIAMSGRFIILDSSDIIADAYMGSGGNINISSEAFLRSPDSKLSASSALGVQGSVLIDSPFMDVAASLLTAPDSFLDVEELKLKRCAARDPKHRSSLMISERGGLPMAPDYPLSGYRDTEKR